MLTCFGFPELLRDFVLNLSSELVYVSIQYFKELCFCLPVCLSTNRLKKACDFYSAKSFNLFV